MRLVALLSGAAAAPMVMGAAEPLRLKPSIPWNVGCDGKRPSLDPTSALLPSGILR